MRATVHLVTAGDGLALRPLLQPVFDRDLRGNSARGRSIAGLDVEALVAAGRALVEERPRTNAELRKLLHEAWPDRDTASLVHAIRDLLPLVQVPPRGIWGAGGLPTLTTAEAWLGRRLEAKPSLGEMIVRYLAAFGPATVNDVQAWSGLTRLREVVERLWGRGRLRTFRDEDGNELFDLPGAPRPHPDTPAPPRFLPEYDNLLLSHADRTRVVADEHRPRFITENGQIDGAVLVDGFVRGSWKIKKQRGTATLTVTPFKRLSKRDAAALTQEGARLLAFTTDTQDHHIQLAPAD